MIHNAKILTVFSETRRAGEGSQSMGSLLIDPGGVESFHSSCYGLEVSFDLLELLETLSMTEKYAYLFSLLNY